MFCLKTLRAIENGKPVEELVPQVGGIAPRLAGVKVARRQSAQLGAALPAPNFPALAPFTPSPALAPTPTPPQDYKPSEKALALMSRGEPKHPFVAGIEDTM